MIPKNLLQLFCRVNGGRFISADEYRELKKNSAELELIQQSFDRTTKEQKQDISYLQTQFESDRQVFESGRQVIESKIKKQQDKFSDDKNTFRGGQL